MGKTYVPKNKKRAKKHGFLARMSTKTGARTITKRRRKGRTKLSV
ncbi:MAG: 50S ribosomal protein L34 [Patescibacteria group bacterium]